MYYVFMYIQKSLKKIKSYTHSVKRYAMLTIILMVNVNKWVQKN